jgi:hypothetical protein
MTHFVIDTNVAVVANGKHPEASLDCIMSCIQTLANIQTNGAVVVDDGPAIFQEYMDHLSLSGQPGVGDAFFRWLWHNQGWPERCERVRITPVNSSFQEFPDDPALAGFHEDDRKFVAVALASQSTPEILNAVDSDWWDFRDALERNGVRVRFLCPKHFAKSGR